MLLINFTPYLYVASQAKGWCYLCKDGCLNPLYIHPHKFCSKLQTKSILDIHDVIWLSVMSSKSQNKGIRNELPHSFYNASSTPDCRHGNCPIVRTTISVDQTQLSKRRPAWIRLVVSQHFNTASVCVTRQNFSSFYEVVARSSIFVSLLIARTTQSSLFGRFSCVSTSASADSSSDQLSSLLEQLSS